MHIKFHDLLQFLKPEHNNASFDIEIIRRDFPILKTKINHKPLVYFDNAATTQKPFRVIQTEKNFYEHSNSNIHRGVHFLSEQATMAYEKSRHTIKDFINAKKSREIIFVKGATDALNLIAYSFAKKYIKQSDEIIISAMEHHSNTVPWQVICEEKGAKLKIIPMNINGELIVEELDTLINEKTRLISLVHVSNSLGTVNPVKEVIQKAHQMGIPVILDGSQAIPHLKIDVQDLDCDFYVFSGHKLYGPTGIGVLYGKEEFLEDLPPYQTGGDMIERVTFAKTTYNVLPYKFEAGTQNIAGAIGLQSAIEYLNSIDFEKALTHEHKLLSEMQNGLKAFEELTIFGTAREKVPVISFTIKDIHPHDIGTYLDNEGIAIRTGHHCTQPVMDFFRIPATARVSFGIYNTLDEVEVFIQTIKKLLNRKSRQLVNFQKTDEINKQFETIINQHNEHSSNYGQCSQCSHTEEGFNAFCGDHLLLHFKFVGNNIDDIMFEGELCAISKSSASIMTELLKGKTIDQAEDIYREFKQIIESTDINTDQILKHGNIGAFSAIKDSPARLKCAVLPWKTMEKAFAKTEVLI